MVEKQATNFEFYAVIDRVNTLIGRTSPHPGVVVVEGAKVFYANRSYTSAISKKETRAGVTAYRANHEPDFSVDSEPVLSETHLLEANDEGTIVILETATLQSQVDEFSRVEFTLKRDGLVFTPEAIPVEEQKRMVLLFGL